MIISVIIPVYKAANYILRCLESVVAQECDAFSIECILVDDCSPDKSMDITKGFIDQYKGSVSFCIISNTENQGPSVARNNGLMIAKGDYVFFLDSDYYLIIRLVTTGMIGKVLHLFCQIMLTSCNGSCGLNCQWWHGIDLYVASSCLTIIFFFVQECCMRMSYGHISCIMSYNL